MFIFLDTEFTELGIDPKLISIGLVSEDGREFYAELSDTYEQTDVGDFARKEVLPLLEGGSSRMTMPELSLRLGNWLESFEQPVRLATDSVSWDWPWIQTLFSDSWTWPANLAQEPEILLFDADPVAKKFSEALQRAFAGGLRRHHALDDAKANRLAWLAGWPSVPEEEKSKTEEALADVDAGRVIDHQVVQDWAADLDPARLKPRYTLTELLAASDPSQPPSAEDRAWLDAPPVGRELL